MIKGAGLINHIPYSRKGTSFKGGRRNRHVKIRPIVVIPHRSRPEKDQSLDLGYAQKQFEGGPGAFRESNSTMLRLKCLASGRCLREFLTD
jgi:hypothetical protein